jgi:PAS domain S-box-containing protein
LWKNHAFKKPLFCQALQVALILKKSFHEGSNNSSGIDGQSIKWFNDGIKITQPCTTNHKTIGSNHSMALFQRTPKMSAGNLAHLLAQEIANTIIEDSNKQALLAQIFECPPQNLAHHPRLLSILQKAEELFLTWLGPEAAPERAVARAHSIAEHHHQHGVPASWVLKAMNRVASLARQHKVPDAFFTCSQAFVGALMEQQEILLREQEKAHWQDVLAKQEALLHEKEASIKAQEALVHKQEEESAHLREIVDTLTEGVAVCGLDGALHDINDAYASLVGYSKAELLQKGWLELTPPEYQAEDQKHVSALLSGQTVTARYEKVYVHRDGHHVPILISYRLLKRRPGWDKDRLVATCVDLTELNTIKAKEQALTRVQAAIDGSDAKIMIANEHGTIIYANASAQKLFADYADEVRKRLPNFNPEKIVGSSYDPYHRNPRQTQAVIEKMTEPHHTTIVFGDRTFAFVANPIFLNSERIGTVVEWRDITEELSVQREVEALITQLKAGDFTMRLTPKTNPMAKRLTDAINNLLDESVALIQYSQRCLDQLAKAWIVPDNKAVSGAAKAIQERYNEAVAGLKTLIGAVRQAGASIQVASAEIQQSQADLTARSSREASSLEEISATAEELSAATSETAKNASESSRLAEDVHHHISSAQQSVSAVTEIILNATKSAEETRGIAQTVQQIAFQTNILSLNASVEAARAGDHGRGFAVIAAEIRNLSNHVSQEARRVETIVDALIHGMQDGEEGILKVAQEIDGIEEASATMAGHAQGIAEAAREQDNGLVELAKGVTSLEEALSQNAAMAEEIQASSEAMTHQVETLMAEIAHFHLGEESQTVLSLPRDSGKPKAEQKAFTDAIRDAIQSHLKWRHTLGEALQTGKIDPRKAGDHRICDFGRWLSADPTIKSHPAYGEIKALHQAFHEEAGRIAQMILAGRKKEAFLATGFESRFRELSDRLLATLKDMQAAIPA